MHDGTVFPNFSYIQISLSDSEDRPPQRGNRAERLLERVRRVAKQTGACDDLPFRDRLARAEIDARLRQYEQKRWTSQPARPSAGCIFKNPREIAAGRLIDELGLKGTTVGGARVSDMHGNFIVNEGGATATWSLKLNSQPSGDVTVGASSNDTTEATVSPSSLTFTSSNWNVTQTVTATGVENLTRPWLPADVAPVLALVNGR